MQEILYLVHRLPYPPSKGDKVRSYNILKHLSKSFKIHLGTFIDDEHDHQYKEDVQAYCKSAYFASLNPTQSRLKSLTGLLTKQPLTLPYYFDKGMEAWVKQTLARYDISAVLVFSGAMAQYVLSFADSGGKLVVDLVDIDSEKWTQYASTKTWPMSWIYRREGKTLLAFEKNLAQISYKSVFVSKEEEALFKRLTKLPEQTITSIQNGVDSKYFSPHAKTFQNPYQSDERVLVFTGAMDYWANVDAVCWFARAVFPSVRKAVKNAQFYIVGSRPSNEVTELGNLEGVCVTGSVKDIRPYLAFATAAVAPLRIARGIQNKVLEAMAMARPVLATSAAAEGIAGEPGEDYLIRDAVDELIEASITLLMHPEYQAMGDAARRCVVERYSWDTNLMDFNRLLNDDTTPREKTQAVAAQQTNLVT